MSITTADQLLQRLREWGVEQVFAYPGDGINGLVGAFSRAGDKPRFIQPRHEEIATLEAVGYAEVQRSARRLHGHVRARRDQYSTCTATPTYRRPRRMPTWPR